MAIKEEPVVVNFIYDVDEKVNTPYRLKFETINDVPYLDIEVEDNSGNSFRVHMDVLVEVVDSLRAKGLIKNHNTAVVPTSPTSRTVGSLAKSPMLQVPTIVKKDNPTVSQQVVQNSVQVPYIEAEPFDSFSPTEIIKEAINTVQAEQVSIPVNAAVPDQIQTDTLVKRPVIRSRVTSDDDPMGAEREAALLRGGASNGKTIKRAE